MSPTPRLRASDAPLAPRPVLPDADGERPLRILHLSDTHICGDPSARYNAIVDTEASLRAVLAAHDHVGGLDVVVVSGDLSEDGTVESYRRLRAVVEPWALAHDARVVLAIGNHDDRAAFRSVFGGVTDGAVELAGTTADDPVTGAVTIRGHRIVVLDTTVPGESYGRLGVAGLEAARLELDRDDSPTIVVMHHPPLVPETPLHQVMALTDAAAVGALLEEAGAALVLSGHWHHQVVDTSIGVPVVVTPGTANRTDLLSRPDVERSVVAGAATLLTIDLLGRFRISTTEAAVADRGTELFARGGDDLIRLGRELGAPEFYQG